MVVKVDPYIIDVPYRDDFEIEAWLIENMPNYNGKQRVVHTGSKRIQQFIFFNIEDAVAFKLVWAVDG